MKNLKVGNNERSNRWAYGLDCYLRGLFTLFFFYLNHGPSLIYAVCEKLADGVDSVSDALKLRKNWYGHSSVGG